MIVCGKDIRVEGRLVRVAHIDGDKYNFPEDCKTLLHNLRNCGERIDLFTFLQKLPETQPKYDFPMEWDNLAVLPISTFENWWTNQINSFPRNRARQAEKKGAVLREVPYGEELVRGICRVYNEVPVRQGKRFPHYGMTIERAWDYAGTYLDRSVYIGAFVGDKMIGFIKMTLDETRTHACLIHILSMVEHKDKAPTNALIARAVRWCADHGVSYLVYERFNYGKKEGDSLSRFKEVNGFRRMDLPRYYIPLTVWGRIAYRLGLHHRFTDRLPESFIARLRELRDAWHQRRFQKVKEA